MKKDLVWKNNHLIEAAYHAGSAWKLRLLHVALFHITDKTTHRTRVRIEAGDMADLVGRDLDGGYYRDLTKAAEDLIRTIITVQRMEDGRIRPGKKELVIVTECEYMPDRKAVELRFSEWALPYLQDLRQNFTKLQLPVIMRMSSGYGIRLYELVAVWYHQRRREDGIKEVSIADFKQLLKIEKLKAYRDIRGLRRKVIEPGVKDVNKHSDFSLEVGYRTAGRKITHIQFRIMRKVKETPAAATGSPLLDAVDGGEFLAAGGSLEDYVTICGNAGAWSGLDRPSAIQAARKETEAGKYRHLKTGEIIQHPGQPVT